MCSNLKNSSNSSTQLNLIKLLTIAAVLLPLTANATDFQDRMRQEIQAKQAKYQAIEDARAAKIQARYANQTPIPSKNRVTGNRVNLRVGR